jgi:YggT family protein
MGYFNVAGQFLLNTLFGLFIYAVLLRFLLQQVRADFYNPVAQFLVSLTNPLLKPLRRITPGVFGIDMASIVLLILLELVLQTLLAMLLNVPLTATVLLVRGAFDLLSSLLTLYLVAILVVVILSWVNPYPNPLSQLLSRLTQPLLRPARKLLPAGNTIDFSPMLVSLVLILLQMAVPFLERGTLELLR